MTTLAPAFSAESDADLCLRYSQGGDQGAFQRLVQRHARMVWLTARRRCGEDGAASEVATAPGKTSIRMEKSLPNVAANVTASATKVRAPGGEGSGRQV